MKKAFARFVLKILGWKLKGEIPKPKKYVLVIAPHTHAIEMIMGKLYNWAADFHQSIIVKKEFFYFPVGYILKAWGGVPIDRSKPENLVNQIVQEFKERDEFVLGITPEGTRKANPNWKTGFWRIAKAADVPVYMVYGDFKKKEMGMLGEFKLTDDMEADMERIKQHFKDINAFRPENFAI